VTLDKLLILNDKSDLVDTPPLGKIYLAYKNGAIQYKDSTGLVSILASGVSPEEVQDIVAGFFTDSATLNVIYDDGAGTLVAEVIQSAIDHTQISNRGTNTHTQIDAHLVDTINPHGTTAAQVGADPAGSAAAAQAIAIERANHTGTQPTSTISGFGAEVLATLLSGYAIGTNALVAATDSVLGAIAKLQGQISGLSAIVSGQILGDNFQQFFDDTPFSTTSITNVVAATFTTNSKPSGTYRIAIQHNWTSSSITLAAIFGLYIDGVLVNQEMRIEANDLLNTPIFNQFTYATFASAGTHTIELRVRASAAFTIGVQRVRAEIWRVV
jgi:hypothetical protein